MTAMSNFIEDYLSDPAQAISTARERAHLKFWYDEFDEEKIYNEISSPEFHLYEAVVMSEENEITPHVSGYAVVA
jgi:hypothetical protein